MNSMPFRQLKSFLKILIGVQYKMFRKRRTPLQILWKDFLYFADKSTLLRRSDIGGTAFGSCNVNRD